LKAKNKICPCGRSALVAKSGQWICPACRKQRATENQLNAVVASLPAAMLRNQRSLSGRKGKG
jgi:uncharacterized Zn finger protein (UPF0148 family)